MARDIFFNVSLGAYERPTALLILYQVPVRRRSHSNVARTLELTKKELENLALVFPHVSFSLDHTNAIHKGRILTVSKVNLCSLQCVRFPETFQISSSLTAFRVLYGKALVEVSATPQLG